MDGRDLGPLRGVLTRDSRGGGRIWETDNVSPAVKSGDGGSHSGREALRGSPKLDMGDIELGVD